jgi:hypothetical protein
MRNLLLVMSACTADPPVTPEPRPQAPGLTPTREVEVVASGPQTCPDPALRSQQRYDHGELRAEAPKKIWFWGGGILAEDLDGDELTDLVLPGFWETQFYRGQPGGGLLEDPLALPSTDVLADQLTLGSGGALADYDGDGDLDLLVTRYLGSNRLLRNDGTGHFEDVTAAAGLSSEPRRSMASSWGDYDRDGDLDLYIGCYGWIDESGEDQNHDDFEAADPDFLYRNEGDGTFTDISELLPQEVHDGYAFSGGWFDLDRDGWLDLYVVNDFGRSFPNRLAWNRQGTFVLDDNAHGLDVQITGMGLGIGDITGDGHEDLVMSAWDGNSAMMSGADGQAWFESVEIVGLQNDLDRHQKIAWGVDLVDMDNDGDLDAPMVYGWLDANYESAPRQPDALYENQGDGTFLDKGPEWGLHHPTAGRGYVAVDLNQDGWLDLVKRDLDGPSLVHLSRCGSEGWLRVSLEQPGPNPFAVGAEVIVRAGERRWSQVIRAGGTNHASSGPLEAHFGLGELSEVDAVEVIWPDGEVSRTEDLPTRQRVRLTRTVL